MRVPNINKIQNSKPVVSKGKVVIKGELSPQNKAFLDEFVNYKNREFSIPKIIKKASAVIKASENNRGNISLKSSYDKIEYKEGKPEKYNVEVWYAILDKGVSFDDNTYRLRQGLLLFENSKFTNKGYTNKFEEIKVKMTSWFKSL